MNSENQNQNQNPQIVRKVFKELEQLSNESLEGIKLITNDANLLDLQAIIDGPGEILDAIFPIFLFHIRTTTKNILLFFRLTLRINEYFSCVNCVYFQLERLTLAVSCTNCAIC